MKYEINRRRLPKARLDQIYTLTIFMGIVSDDAPHPKEAKVQYPVISYGEGIRKYRELKRIQTSLIDETFISDYPNEPQTVESPYHDVVSVADRTPGLSNADASLPLAV